MIVKNSVIAGDGHFHLYPCFDPARAINALVDNLNLLAGSASGLGAGRDVFKIAFLTEGGQFNYFQKILRKEVVFPQAGFEISAGPEEHCLSISRDGGLLLVLMAGRQVATLERLEILGLGMEKEISDALPEGEIIDKIIAAGGLPVLPFSPGKWLFKRGKLARRLAEKYGRKLIIGDSALRPIGWGAPEIMRRARKINQAVLAGSDPLPMAGEEKYAGRYGFVYQGPFDASKPLTAIREIIADKPEMMMPVGRRRSMADVVRSLYCLKRKNKKISASSAPLR